METAETVEIVKYMTESPTGAVVVVCLLGVYVGLVLIGCALRVVSFEGCKPKFGKDRIRDKMHEIVLVVLGAALGLAIAGFSGWHLYRVIRVPKVVVWTGLEEDELRFFEKSIVPGFEEMMRREQQRKVRVKVVNRPWIETLKALEDGKRIDVITFDINGARNRLIDEGWLQELSKYRELVPSSVHPTLLRASGHEGRRYFVPYRPNVRLLFLNKGKYKRLLELPPTADCNVVEKLGTWEGVREFVEALSNKGQCEAGAVINAKGPAAALFLLEFVWSAGGDPYDLRDDETKQAIEWLRGLWPYVSKRSRPKTSVPRLLGRTLAE